MTDPPTDSMHLCIKCRALLGDGDWCGHGAHLHVDLADPAKRFTAMERVYQRAVAEREEHTELPEQSRETSGPWTSPVAWFGALATLIGVVLLRATPSVYGVLLVFAVLLTAAGVGALVLVALANRTGVIEAKTTTKLIPGTPERITGVTPRRALPSPGAPGRIADAGPLTAPTTGRPAAAYAIELHHSAAAPGTLMLAHARTSALTIDLDDGRTVRIPAGPIHIHPAPPDVTAIAAHDRTFVDELVGSDDGLIIHDIVRERCLRLGDRVAFNSELIEGPRAVDETSPFRGHVTAVYVPRGTPVLTVLDE